MEGYDLLHREVDTARDQALRNIWKAKAVIALMYDCRTLDDGKLPEDCELVTVMDILNDTLSGAEKEVEVIETAMNEFSRNARALPQQTIVKEKTR